MKTNFIPEIQDYLQSLWLAKGLSDNTLENYGRDLTRFNKWLQPQGRRLIDARDMDVLGYLADLTTSGAKPASVARHLSCLKGYFRTHGREQGLAVDPTALIQAPK